MSKVRFYRYYFIFLKNKKIFLDIKDENIVSAGLIAAFEVNKLMTKRRSEGKPKLPIYLVGTNGLRTILEAESGVECFGTGPDNISDYTEVCLFFFKM